MPKVSAPLALLVALPTLMACGGNDCTTERYCQSIGGELTCIWVRRCGDEVEPVARRTYGTPTVVFPAGEYADVRLAGGEGVARFLGQDVLAAAGMGEAAEWWLHKWPLEDLHRAVGDGAAVGLREVRDAATREASACAPSSRVTSLGLPPLPDHVRSGESLFFHAPFGALPGHVHLGLAVRVTHETGEGLSFLLAEGEATEVRLDRPGVWTVRSFLLSRDLCDVGVADAVHLQREAVTVRGSPR